MLNIQITKPSEQEIEDLDLDTWGRWAKDVSKFEWDYTAKETCYIFEGEVTVETEWETVSFKAGDLVVFPEGLKCIWNIKKPVVKAYRFD